MRDAALGPVNLYIRIMCRRYVRRSPTEGRVTSPENALSSGLVIYT